MNKNKNLNHSLYINSFVSKLKLKNNLE